MKVIWIKAIFQKIWQNLIIKLDQKKREEGENKNNFDSINALYEDQD